MNNNKHAKKVNITGWITLIVGLAVIILSFVINTERSYYNYLIMYMFIVSISLGSLGLVSLEYITGAVWSTPFRRVSEFLSSAVPFLIILVIPLIFGMHTLYHWTHEETVLSDEILKSKSPYLNINFFIIRTVLFFLFWVIFYYIITKNSTKQDENGDVGYTKRNIKISIAFAPVFLITLTFTAIDFMMSLEPHWYSTIYGIYYFAGTIVSALSALVFASVKLLENGKFDSRISNRHFHSMGTLLFGMNIFWAYIAFSQYLLIWYADIPEETVFLQSRMNGSWKYVSLALLIIHFIVPFIVLITHSAKTNLKILKIMSIWLLFSHLLDLYWLIMPNYSPQAVVFSFYEIGFPLFAIGLFIILFKMKEDKVNLMPVKDPKLQAGIDLHLYPDISID